MIETVQQRIAILEKKVGSEVKSPLFAQLAHYYLEENRAEDALRVCDAGLANFPFYSTGHLIKGKALATLHMLAEARRELEFVIDFLPTNETVSTLLAQIPPGEEEILTAEAKGAQPEISEPDQISPPAAEYIIPSTPQLRPETDYGSIVGVEPVAEQQPESPPVSEPSSGLSFFDAITQAPTATTPEDSFNFEIGTPQIETPEAPEFSGLDVPKPTPTYDGAAAPSSFDDIPTTISEQPTMFELPVSAPESGIPTEVVISEEEAFEKYAAQRRKELSNEDTLTLEDYFNNVSPGLMQSLPTPVAPVSSDIPGKIEEFLPPTVSPVPEEVPGKIEEFLPPTVSPVPEEVLEKVEDFLPPPITPIPPEAPDQIEELTAKLKNVGRITPNIDITPVIDIAEKEPPPPPSEQDTTPIGFVTPTLAEIYAKQGWFDDAIKAYKTLIRTKPGERERFEKRITELEGLKSQGSK